jgi:hypothetical protein
MEKVEDFRANAAKCRALAGMAKTEYIRTELLKMAATWEQLAADRETMLIRQNRQA